LLQTWESIDIEVVINYCVVRNTIGYPGSIWGLGFLLLFLVKDSQTPTNANTAAADYNQESVEEEG